MRYVLYLKSGCSIPDLEDECEAHSFAEAQSTFRARNPRALREVDDETLLKNVFKEPKQEREQNEKL